MVFKLMMVLIFCFFTSESHGETLFNNIKVKQLRMKFISRSYKYCHFSGVITVFNYNDYGGEICVTVQGISSQKFEYDT